MNTKSCKAKGRKLAQAVRDMIQVFLFNKPGFSADLVDYTRSGVGGADVPLFGMAREWFPIQIECKNQERADIWGWFKQCKTHGNKSPVVFFKKNGEEPHVAMPASLFFDLLDLHQELNASLP